MKTQKYNQWKESEDFSSYTNYTEDGNFWGTVGAGILPISQKTGRILLQLRSKYVNEPNLWSGCWGGKLDDQETNDPKEAAKVEFKEESGYDKSIKLIDAHIFETPSKKFKYYNYIGLIKNEFTPKLNWEVQDYKWVTYDEMFKINPKHFGFEELLLNSGELIKKYSNI